MDGNETRTRFSRLAYSLVELVVAVLIIGILSAIAIPRYMSHVRRTIDQTHKIKLMLIRDAIERYVADNDRELPPSTSETIFKKSLEDYLGAEFPSIDIQFNSRTDAFDPDGVRFVTSTDLVIPSELVPTKGWQYDTATGQIFVNLRAQTALDPGTTYEQW